MSAKEKIQLSDYQKNIHRFGRITNIIAVTALLAVPLFLSITSGISIDVPTTIKGFIGIGTLMGVMCVVEFMSFAPILGAGATYLTFITGNTMNMKLPAAISSVKLAGVKQNSEEADIISTMAVAVSSLVTIVILLAGLLGLSFILPILNAPALKPGFNNLMPALLGAMGVPVLIRNLKGASVPFILAIILTFVLGAAAFAQFMSIMMPIFMAISVGWTYILYRQKKKKEITSPKA